MLTADLVSARIVRKKVRPRYVNARDPELLELAAQLIETFDAHEGAPRGELEDALREIQGNDTDFLLHRSFAKLLFDRCTFEATSVREPEVLRRSVFEAAAEAWRGSDETMRFERASVLAAAVDALSTDPSADDSAVEDPLQPVTLEDLEAGLYADLKDEQRLMRWRRVGADWLLRRYNVALAQGVLLRASELEIELAADDPLRHRALFRKIKFHRLMHRIARRDDGGWRVRLDGPLSLFRASGKYGLAMANFLPTLLCFDGWRLEARVRWGPKRRPCGFELSGDDGLRSHQRLDGQWRPDELTWLPDQLAALDADWRAEVGGEIVDLGGHGVLVPDYVFHHAPSGQRVVMEIFGFWNRGAVDARLALLRRHGPERSILALSSQLACGREGLDDLPGEVYVYRTHPLARKVLALLRGFVAKVSE
ncbi:MAG: DUF790 family protein [Acidobacteriota bacterium]